MTVAAELLRALPKVELHCHIEGTMRPETVMDLAGRNHVRLPANDVRDLYRYRSLDEFLAVFWLVQSVLADREDWARLAYEPAVDAADAGRVYAEVFLTPARHLAAGQSLREVLAGLEEGLAAADAETGCRTMLIVDMDRAYGPDAGRQLVEALVELRREGAAGTERVLGIGMDSTEIGVDPLAFLPAYRAASSAWTVPVSGNNAGEPCHGAPFVASFCTQAWRWNLDYVVDPHGNTMSLYYNQQTNLYGRNDTTPRPMWCPMCAVGRWITSTTAPTTGRAPTPSTPPLRPRCGSCSPPPTGA